MHAIKTTSGPLSFIAKLLVAIFAVCISVTSFAQDAAKEVDVNINTDSGGGGFFASPWVWVVGIAVFILLLVALLRGGRREV